MPNRFKLSALQCQCRWPNQQYHCEQLDAQFWYMFNVLILRIKIVIPSSARSGNCCFDFRAYTGISCTIELHCATRKLKHNTLFNVLSSCKHRWCLRSSMSMGRAFSIDCVGEQAYEKSDSVAIYCGRGVGSSPADVESLFSSVRYHRRFSLLQT